MDSFSKKGREGNDVILESTNSFSFIHHFNTIMSVLFFFRQKETLLNRNEQWRFEVCVMTFGSMQSLREAVGAGRRGNQV